MGLIVDDEDYGEAFVPFRIHMDRGHCSHGNGHDVGRNCFPKSESSNGEGGSNQLREQPERDRRGISALRH